MEEASSHRESLHLLQNGMAQALLVTKGEIGRMLSTDMIVNYPVHAEWLSRFIIAVMEG